MNQLSETRQQIVDRISDKITDVINNNTEAYSKGDEKKEEIFGKMYLEVFEKLPSRNLPKTARLEVGDDTATLLHGARIAAISEVIRRAAGGENVADSRFGFEDAGELLKDTYRAHGHNDSTANELAHEDRHILKKEVADVVAKYEMIEKLSSHPDGKATVEKLETGVAQAAGATSSR